MPERDLEYLLRPVARGMCRFESLLDGTLDLAHLAAMNDYLTVEGENQARANEAAVAAAKSGGGR